MKKSELYRTAMIAIILSEDLCVEDKIEILAVLYKDEELALFAEKKEEEK